MKSLINIASLRQKYCAVSLRSRLLGIIGASLIVLWSAVAIWMVMDLRGELRATLDQRLAASARMIAGLLSQMPAPQAPLDGKTMAPLNVIGRDGLACEVSLIRGEVTQTIAGTAGSPSLSGAELGYSTGEFGGRVWRTYVLQQGNMRIATADRLDVRDKLLRDVALTASIPFLVALLGSLFVLWFGIGKGLAPIERVRAVLAARRPDDSAPLAETNPPFELRPLIDTIRNLLQRVHAMITFERQFTDDAAHELRTPLTAIKTHLQVARLASTSVAPAGTHVMMQALSHADQGVLRLQHTLDQLLLLARLDGGAEHEMSSQTNVAHAARQAMNDAQTGRSPSDRIVLQAPEQPIFVPLQETLLISALRNLLDNALRHGPPDTTVQLLIEQSGATVRFTVTDHGPGLSREDCTHATQRFWRRHDNHNNSGGSGLGLSIVNAIARFAEGDFQLAPGDGGGLVAQLVIPMKSLRAHASALPSAQ